MKMRLVITFAIFAFCSIFYTSAQTYHPEETAVLKEFLLQDAVNADKNYECLGLTAEDMDRWDDETMVKLRITWTDELPHRIKKIYWLGVTDKKLGGILDCSAFEKLESLFILGGISEHVRVNVSDNPLLYALGCPLTSDLDISNNLNLMALVSGSGDLSTLDLSRHTKLEEIEITEVPLEKIILPEPNNLRVLYLKNCSLKFSTLPLPSPQYEEYYYHSQRVIEGGVFAIGDTVDLHSEIFFGVKMSEYKWYVKEEVGEGMYEMRPISLPSAGYGLFRISDYAGKRLQCAMTNTTFPGLKLYYELDVKAADDISTYHPEETEVLKNFLLQNGWDRKNYEHIGLTAEDMDRWDGVVMSNIGVTWTDTEIRRVEEINWGAFRPKGPLDCSVFESLKVLKLTCLKVDVSKNHLLEEYFNTPCFSGNDDSANPLENIINHTQLRAIHTTVDSSVKSLDFSQFSNLVQLDIRGDSLREIIMPEINNLKNVSIGGIFTFSTLPPPLPQYEYFSCVNINSPIYERDEKIAVGEIIDLSSEYSVGDYKTVYTWDLYKAATNEEIYNVDLISAGDGKFIVPDFSGWFLMGKATNPAYPSITLWYKFKINGESTDIQRYHSEELSVLKDFLLQDGQEGKKNYEHFGLTEADMDRWDAGVISKLDIIWNSDTYPLRAERFNWIPKRLAGSLDCSKFEKLRVFHGLFIDFTHIDLTNNPLLEDLACPLTSDLDLSRFPQLKSFGAYKGDATSVDLSQHVNLEYIEFSDLPLQEIILPEPNNLKRVYLGMCNFKFSTLPLPLPQYIEYSYHHQQVIDGGVFAIGETVDLSSEYLIGDQTTVYEWYIKEEVGEGMYEMRPIALPSVGNGKFRISAYGGMRLQCIMTNATFPNMKQYYEIDVQIQSLEEAYHPDDLAGLKTFLSQPVSSERSSAVNYKRLGLTDEDMDVWNVETIEKIEGVEWTVEQPKRITNINWNSKGVGGDLDCSKFEELKTLSFAKNMISSLEAGENKKLEELNCSENNLTVLDLKNNTSLTSVVCSSNEIETLLVPNSVKTLDCGNNNLTISTLPDLPITDFSYWDQKPIDMGIKSVGDIIDLSSEYSVNGRITKYDWYADSRKVSLTEKGNGKFEIGTDVMSKALECRLTNETYSGLTIKYTAYVSGTSDIKEGYMQQGVSVLSNVVKINEPVTIVNESGFYGRAHIYTVNGKKLGTTDVRGGETLITVSDPGIYLLQVELSGNILQTFKIMVR